VPPLLADWVAVWAKASVAKVSQLKPEDTMPITRADFIITYIRIIFSIPRCQRLDFFRVLVGDFTRFESLDFKRAALFL